MSLLATEGSGARGNRWLGPSSTSAACGRHGRYGGAGLFALATSRVTGTSRLTSEPSDRRLRAPGAAVALVQVPAQPMAIRAAAAVLLRSGARPLGPVRC
jgi:hypothetical protein